MRFNLAGPSTTTKTAELLELERKYCSFGDTVHYLEPPKVFVNCEGSYLYDEDGTPYLDLQMWYSAASFGYKNPRLNAALKRQIDRLPQLACQYLHAEKVEVAARMAQYCEKRFGVKGRVQFNVGGAQAIEDSLKIVRNSTGKNLMFAFMGGYHGRTLGASAITSSYRYRRRYGHFGDRAQFIFYPYCFRCIYGLKRPACDIYCEGQFEKLFESEYHSVWDAKAGASEYGAFYIEPVQGTGGYVIPPREYFTRLRSTCDRHKILIVDDEIQMGFYRTGKFWTVEHLGITPAIIVFGLALRIEVCKPDGTTPDRDLTDRIFAEGLKGNLEARGRRYGLVLDVGGYYKNVFTLAPSFTITREEIDLALELLDQLFERCRG